MLRDIGRAIVTPQCPMLRDRTGYSDTVVPNAIKDIGLASGNVQ